MNFVMIAYLLKADATVEVEIDWKKFYGTLPEGKYRIVKNVSPDARKEEVIYIAVGFMIK